MPYAFADGTICCQTQWSPPTYETNSAFFQNPDCPVNQTSVLDDPSLACCGFNEPLTCEYSTCSHNSEIRNKSNKDKELVYFARGYKEGAEVTQFKLNRGDAAWKYIDTNLMSWPTYDKDEGTFSYLVRYNDEYKWRTKEVWSQTDVFVSDVTIGKTVKNGKSYNWSWRMSKSL